MESNQSYEVYFASLDDSALLRERVSLIRTLGHITDQLAMVNEERRKRAPQQSEEAEIVQIRHEA